MFAFIRRRCDTLLADPALARYGAVLAAMQLLTLAWMVKRHVWHWLARGGEVICWPTLPACAAWRVLEPGQIVAWLALITLLGLGAGAAFLRRHRAAWWLLALNQLLLLALIAQDFRLRRNQHYMLSFVIAAYLLMPDPRRALRYLLVLFYVWAGTLKLNKEWLSGAALYGPVPVSGFALRLACGYVVLLELFLIWGLLSKSRRLFLISLIQLLLFELASFPIVGFFYPLLMAGLMSLFWLARQEEERPLRLLGERHSTYALLIGFSALQLVPYLFPGDTAITGEGRLFALHMFDAQVECASQAVLRNGEQIIQTYDLRRGLAIRVACDPAVALARGKTLCAHYPAAPWRIDLSLESRRSSDPSRHRVVSIADFCANVPEYKWWKHNAWIQIDSSGPGSPHS